MRVGGSFCIAKTGLGVRRNYAGMPLWKFLSVSGQRERDRDVGQLVCLNR